MSVAMESKQGSRKRAQGGTPYAKEVGARIAQAREERGLTQDELATLVGVSPRPITDWENGKTVPYRWMAKLSEVLRRSEDWIKWGEAGDPNIPDRQLRSQLSEIDERLDGLEKAARGMLKILSDLAPEELKLDGLADVMDELPRLLDTPE